MRTSKNAALRNLSGTNIDLNYIEFNLSYKSDNYILKFHNSFNISYDCQITKNGKSVKGFTTTSAPSIKLCIELINESNDYEHSIQQLHQTETI